MPYIGKSPTGSGVRQRFHFTATGGETSLSGADDNSKTLKFTDGEFLDVYLNGVLLVQGTDYGVGTTNTISSLAALSAGDIVEIIVYDIFNVAKINSEAVRARHYYTATGSETSIGTAQISGLSFAANADIDVSLNGISLVAGTDYNTTTANTVGGLSALTAGQVVEIVIYEKFQLADTVSKASGGTFNGGVTFNSGFNVGTIKEATGTTTAMTIDSTGRILTPARPAFRGTRSYTTTDFTGSGLDITGYTEDFDIGSAFDASAGTYTVPITGIYQINVTQDGSSNFSAATNTFLRLKIDGVVDNTTLIARQDPEGGQSSSSTICQTLSLTANQVLLVNFLTGTDDSVAANFVFSGFLVG